jgi:nucleoside-triphosphatase THEP1
MNKKIYYRLIALWVFCEAMLGGIIHGFRIPVSGLVVGSCAIVCICLLAWYIPVKGAIIKATIIVAIFKMMLSPQAPPPAYIAVFFQGLMGELLFWNKRYFRLSCILLAVLGLLESGLQRILVLTIIYGNDLWKVINDFINGLTKQKTATNYSLLIGSGYVVLHLVTGLFVGWWASLLPKRIRGWSRDKQYRFVLKEEAPGLSPAAVKKKKRFKKGLFIIWLLLIVLYVQSYFKIGTPLLPSHISLKILLRSLIIVLGWLFIIGPLLKQLLHGWLKKKQTRSQQDVQEIVSLLPVTQQLIIESWKRSATRKGLKRISLFSKIILANSFADTLPAHIYILSGPVQSGKTTALLNWAAGRNDVFGILTPVQKPVPENSTGKGHREFMDTHTGETFPMEARAGETALTVGRFEFSKQNFEKAIALIRNAIPLDGWLVIDEIGPLELRGEGFHDLLLEVLQQRKGPVILVTREGMVEAVQKQFGIKEAIILTPDTLTSVIQAADSRHG